MAYDDEFSSLPRQQANQSQFAGAEGARLADPFAPQRGQYQNQLSRLMANPGDFASSPTYKFAYDQGMGALTASAAARGRLNSGNYLKDLMDYGQGKASQLFFPQANLLSTLSGATTGSPGAAGLSYTSGINRSQDQNSAALAARGMQGAGGGRMSESQRMMNALPVGGGGVGTGLPSGGAFPSYGGYGDQSYKDPMYGYTPAANAGTGYMLGNYGDQEFNGPGSQYYSFGGGTQGQPSMDYGMGGGDMFGGMQGGGWNQSQPWEMPQDYSGFEEYA